MKRVLVAMVSLLAAACSSSSSAPASINGNILGQSFSVKDAVSQVVTSGGEADLEITIASVSPLCAANINRKNGKALILDLNVGAAGATGNTYSAPTAPGTFTVQANQVGNNASASYFSFDASCNNSGNASAASGTVTLTGLNPAKGTFDLTLGSDHVTGSFTANSCSITNPTTSCN